MAPLDDAARTLRDYADSIDRSPERLQAIEDRLAALARLKRRYGPTLDEVVAKAQAIAEELTTLGAGDEARLALEEAALAAQRAYRSAADTMAAARRAAAPRLARALEKALAELAMSGTRCELVLQAIEPEGEWGPTGTDRLDLLISPNLGEDLRPLGRIVSGGELSRVMLAMKSLASTDVPGKTLIFDEVDAGIGGAVADVVGARLHALSAGCQVLCITHLPQVAAFGDEHYRVSKRTVDGRTVTRVERLDEEARETEVARMMGGQAVSAGVRAGARDLLAAQARRKAKVVSKAKGESRRL
jgi:DNA repair protein RecN (Recombination protein N)